MSTPWKIAVLVDPITALVTDAAHPLGLARELSLRGHTVRLFGMAPSATSRSAGRPADSTPGAPAAKPPTLGASVALFGPQAVVAYDALSPAAWLGARAAKRHAAALVLIETGPWSQRRPAQRALWRVGEALWGRYVRAAASAVLALEPQARDRSIRRGFAPDRVRSVAHGIDPEHHRPGLSSDELLRRRIRGRILSCRTSYAEPERVETLIDAFSATVGQRDDWSLVVVGEGPPPARVAKCAYRAGLGGRTHFLTVSDAEFAPLLSSSTMFAALGEAGVRAVWDVERALACGVPTLIGASARGAHLVQHDANGWLAERTDLLGWTAALARAAASPQARRRWSQAARAFALEHLAWSGVVRAVESVVEARLHEPLAEPDASASQAIGA